MNVVENAKVSEKAENVEKNVNAGEKNVNAGEKKADQKNIEVIAKMIMEKLNGLNIELSEISELSNLVKEVVRLNVEIQKLSEERLQKLNRCKELYEKLNGEAKNILQILGLINIEEIEKVIGVKTQTAKTTVERVSRGNGLSDKKIVYNGKMYNMATYFCRKHGITGGLPGLEQWARARGLSLKVEDDVIFIV